ncbi:branched-chain amino acid transaminase [Candidatus Saccharibacteria bacterium]|nr:branched-chain amino acid transaminase [Candidatus Saccharibacteria bacterium]
MASHQDYLEYAYLKGKVLPFKEANVPIATNALQYGLAIFGGVKGYLQDDGKIGILRLDDHLERLKKSAKVLRFPFDFDDEFIKQTFIDLTRKNKPKSNVYYRPIIYRSDIALSPAIAGDYDFGLYMLSLGDYFDKSRGLRVCVSSWVRNSDNALPPRTKASGGYVNAALAIEDAARGGYDSAIMLDSNGFVGEGAVMNIYIVRDGRLITPSVNSDILEGITRKTVLQLAKDNNITVEVRQISRTELYIADEVFFSGTATELTWCESIDKVEISSKPGPVYQQLNENFNAITQGKRSDFLFKV